jgi:hypothetical protein
MRLRSVGAKSATYLYRRIDQGWAWISQDWKHVGYVWAVAFVLMGISLIFNIGLGSSHHSCTHGASSIGPINLQTGKGAPAKTEACLP